MKHPLSVIIATFGGQEWFDLGWSRAWPSVKGQTRKAIVVHDNDGPIERVRNRVAETVTGEWLCFLDADDELAPGYVDAMEEAIKAGDKRRLLAPLVSFDGSDPVVPNGRSTMPPLNHCVVGTVLHRRLFEGVGGFRSEYWPWSDYELWLRCARTGARVEFVPGAVYRVNVNPGSDNNRLTRAEGDRLGKLIHDEHRAAGGAWPIEGGEASG